MLGAAIPTSAQLRATAQAFEAQALGQLLQPVFATLNLEHSRFGGGSAAAQWQPMLVEAMAGGIARAGGLGLAAPVLREMLRMQAGRSEFPTPPTQESAP